MPGIAVTRFPKDDMISKHTSAWVPSDDVADLCGNFKRKCKGLKHRIPQRVCDKQFIDATGQKLRVVDQGTGKVQDVEVFVAILGCS
jgi:hypothetical protein